MGWPQVIHFGIESTNHTGALPMAKRSRVSSTNVSLSPHTASVLGLKSGSGLVRSCNNLRLANYFICELPYRSIQHILTAKTLTMVKTFKKVTIDLCLVSISPYHFSRE